MDCSTTPESVLISSGSREADVAFAGGEGALNARPMEVNVSQMLEEVQRQMASGSPLPADSTRQKDPKRPFEGASAAAISDVDRPTRRLLVDQVRQASLVRRLAVRSVVKML